MWQTSPGRLPARLNSCLQGVEAIGPDTRNATLSLRKRIIKRLILCGMIYNA
jgi:hypothetical protein